MGGNSASTPQLNQLGQLFGQNAGYQQPNQVAPMQQPQQAPITPTPEDAAAATRARMAARMPAMAAPAAAPRKNTMMAQGGNGSAGGRGSGGAW